MKKIVFASLVAAASLGLGACAESASDDAAMEEEPVMEEEAAPAGAEAMAAEGEMEGEGPAEESGDMPDGPETPVETSPSGDPDGPTPSRN